MKPGLWWRAQIGCVHSAKLVRLSDKAHRNWFNLNCIANAHGGVLPDLDTVATDLRMSTARAAAAITELVTKRLFDKRADGSFVPHDYEEWQFKTDVTDPTNADRQKKFRGKQREELRMLKALRDGAHNALRNGVSNVMAKRPDTETDITTSVSVEKGLGNGAVAKPVSEVSRSELAAMFEKRKTTA